MFDTTTDTLALFIGLYMASAAVGLLVDPKGYAGLMDEFRANNALTYISAIFVFFLGAFIISIHNVWTGPTEVLISLAGWGALIEGMLLLAVREKFLDLWAPFAANQTFMLYMAIFTLALGGLLLFSALT